MRLAREGTSLAALGYCLHTCRGKPNQLITPSQTMKSGRQTKGSKAPSGPARRVRGASSLLPPPSLALNGRFPPQPTCARGRGPEAGAAGA